MLTRFMFWNFNLTVKYENIPKAKCRIVADFFTKPRFAHFFEVFRRIAQLRYFKIRSNIESSNRFDVRIFYPDPMIRYSIIEYRIFRIIEYSMIRYQSLIHFRRTVNLVTIATYFTMIIATDFTNQGQWNAE